MQLHHPYITNLSVSLVLCSHLHIALDDMTSLSASCLIKYHFTNQDHPKISDITIAKIMCVSTSYSLCGYTKSVVYDICVVLLGNVGHITHIKQHCIYWTRKWIIVFDKAKCILTDTLIKLRKAEQIRLPILCDILDAVFKLHYTICLSGWSTTNSESYQSHQHRGYVFIDAIYFL